MHNAHNAAPSFALNICDAQVDRETGKVSILRYTCIRDAGKAVHPAYVEGQIQAILNSGAVELFAMTYHGDYPTTEGYVNWINYALAQNPNTRIALALPWGSNPESTDAATYASGWNLAHSTAWHAFVDTLRGLYPGVDIYCIP